MRYNIRYRVVYKNGRIITHTNMVEERNKEVAWQAIKDAVLGDSRVLEITQLACVEQPPDPKIKGT